MKQLVLRSALIGLLLSSVALPVSALPRERDEWMRVTTDNFLVFSNASERSTRRIATNLERLRAVLVQLEMASEQVAGQPVYLYIFDNNLSMVPYKPLENGKPANVAGFTFLRPEGTYIMMQDDSGEDAERLVYQGYLYHVMGASYGRLPLWLSEGMADLYSTFKSNDQNAEIGRAVDYHIRTLRENSMLPLARLFAVNQGSTDYNKEYRQSIFFAQSWALVHYLLLGNPERRPQTFQFFNDVSRGTPAPQAFRNAFQTTEAQIEKELRDYVQRSLFNYAQIPVKPAAELKIRVEPLPREETLTRLGDLLLYQQDKARLPQAEEHYRAALAAKSGYGPAQAGLCRIESEAGRAAASLACFEKAAQAAPDDASLQSQYARVLREQGPQDAATPVKTREALARAAALQPDNSQVWVELSLTYINDNPMPPEGLQAFESAWRLRPGNPVAAQHLVLAYARSGQSERAAQLIETDLARISPGEARRGWGVWVSERTNEANRLLVERKLDEALPILEEVVRRAPADLTQSMATELTELRRVAEHNRFAKRYNEAVALLQEQKVEEAHAILQELTAITTLAPEDAAAARKLAGEVEAFLKARKKKG